MKKFVILSTQRSGSTLLVTYLNQHSNITCYKELFSFTPPEKNPNYSRAGYKEYIHRNYSRKFLSFLNKNFLIENYLKDLYGFGSSDAVGFKLMYNQLKHKTPLKKWLQKRDVYVIHLIRENLLKTLSSEEIAKKNQKYVSKSSKVQNNTSVHINTREILSDLQKRKSKIESHKLNKKEYYEITYEDITNNTKETVKSILSFLNLEKVDVDLEDKIHKQNPRSLDRRIDNYNEVVKKLTNTEFEVLLDVN